MAVMALQPATMTPTEAGRILAERGYTADQALQVARSLAAEMAARFPGAIDQLLLERQIESDFLEWAEHTRQYTYRQDNNGRPVRPGRAA